MLQVKEDIDEYCNPRKPRILNYLDVVQAAKLLKPHIKATPCVPARTQEEFGINIYYKLEFLHRSGCFKERGALYALLKIPVNRRKLGVIIAATGNEAIGLCYHAKKLSISATIVAPVTLPLSKVHKINSMDGKLILYGSTFAEAITHARALAKQKGMVYINIRDHPHALAGFGTLGLEIMEQAPFADAILVPIGTGALAAAIATVVKQKKPSCLVYGVESENLGLMTKSLEKGEPVSNLSTAVGSLAGNALSVNVIGVNAFASANSLLDRVLLVKEDWIARAMLHLAEREKFIVEGTAACTLAAILGFLVPELKQKNVICLLTGGNVDSLMLNRSLQRGLTAEGRLVKFKVGVYNKPNAASDLMKLLATRGYNIITHFIDNCWTEGDTCRAEMKIVVESRNLEHSFDLKRIIDREYPDTAVFDNDLLSNKRCYGSVCKDPHGKRSKLGIS
ncbi:unnamed protein product [Arctia plantaginis]|uniref:L-serine deaminase n=1 Tax=Arctia plantaginis TaxID=874455 RepID=A0A8S1AN00_ARCPL|nr:unnamed protein product [Arctia plantaginis]